MSFARAPSLPIAVLLIVAPGMAVAQFRAMAPAVTIGLVLAVVAYWRNHRRLPWPARDTLLPPALALLGWALVSCLWSIEAARGVETTLALVALLLVGAMATRAVAEDPAEFRARLGPALLAGLCIGIALLAFDHATQNLFRLAVRGFPAWNFTLAFGLKPAVSLLALLLPLLLALPRPHWAIRWAVLVAGLAVAMWLDGETAKIAAVTGIAAALAAQVAPRLVARTGAVALGGLFLLAPVIFTLVLARVPDLSPLPLSASHRVLIWDFSVARIADHPMLGWGMESAREIPGGAERFDPATLARFGLTSEGERHYYGSENTRRLPLHTHNAALQVWLELGLVGALLATWLAAAVMLAAGASPIAPTALGVAVSGAVTGQLSFGVWQPWWVASLVLVALVLRALAPDRPR
jgi:O-antigen ligase